MYRKTQGLDARIGPWGRGIGDEVEVLLAIDPSTRETGWALFGYVADHRDASGPSDAKPAEHAPSQDGQKGCYAHPSWNLLETGVIVPHPRPQRVEVAERVEAIKSELHRMASRWSLGEVACGKPSPLQLPQQQAGVELLSRTLDQWAKELGISLRHHQAKDIRSAMLGRATGARQELAFAVMNRWGLLGEARTTAEWNAIAVGDYHLGQLEQGQPASS